MNIRKKVRKLLEILNYKRPAGSKTEEAMIKKYIDTLPNVRIDGFGNRIVRVGSDNTTMFSCHTDTVHHTEGMQKVYIDEQRGEMFVNHNECLGADDGAGIIIMISMINAGVNGLYVFHREEEIGGNGSNYIQQHTPELLDGIDRCIAFDRRGTQSIITHQFGERCCSEEFAEEFAQQLMKGDLWFFPDTTGSFTDSANYTHLISECTNLSCGYESEHTSNETLDIMYLQKLINQLVKVNFDDLISSRDPTEIDYDFGDYNYHYGYSNYLPAPNYSAKEIAWMSNKDIMDLVYDDPDTAVELIKEYRNMLKYDFDQAI